MHLKSFIPLKLENSKKSFSNLFTISIYVNCFLVILCRYSSVCRLLGSWILPVPSVIREDPQFTVHCLFYCNVLCYNVYCVMFGVLYCIVLHCIVLCILWYLVYCIVLYCLVYIGFYALYSLFVFIVKGVFRHLECQNRYHI